VDNIERLTGLVEGTSFRNTPDWSLEYPLADFKNHNLAEWDKLGDKKKERITNLVSAILADIVRPLALEQFGHTGDSAIRTVLYNELFQKDNREELASLGQQMRKEAVGNGLNNMQADMLQQWFISYFPTWWVACIAELINSRDSVKRPKIIWNIESAQSYGGIYDLLLKKPFCE